MKFLLPLFILLIVISPVFAGEIKICPDYVLIPIGGSNSTNITFILDEDDGIQQNHSIFLKFFNENGNLTSNITGILYSDEVYLEKEQEDVGIIKYTWRPEKAGTYNFTLTLWFSGTVRINEEFDVFIEDKYVQEGRPKITVTGYADVEAIPEIFTILLVALGIPLLMKRIKS